jgi:hypothetical protein
VSRQVKGWREQEVGHVAQYDGEESLEEIEQHNWFRRRFGAGRVLVFQSAIFMGFALLTFLRTPDA